MEEKKSIKISLSTCLLFISLIIIAIMGVVIYVLYTDRQKCDSVAELYEKIANLENAIAQKDEDSKVAVEETKKDEKETLNIESDLVKKLYKYVADFSYYDELIAYQSNKVTEKEMNNSLKLLTIFNNLENKDATRIEYKYENEEIPKREHVIFDKSVIEDKAIEIFGENVTIKHQDAAPYDGHNIDYKNNEYDSYDYEGGGAVPWEMSTRILISAEKDEDGTIYLYDKYIHLVEVENIKPDGSNWAGTYDIYASSDKKEKLASKVDTVEKDIKLTEIKDVEKYLGKELPMYKHTYKQNSEGNYYWYSTEPIK